MVPEVAGCADESRFRCCGFVPEGPAPPRTTTTLVLEAIVRCENGKQDRPGWRDRQEGLAAAQKHPLLSALKRY